MLHCVLYGWRGVILGYLIIIQRQPLSLSCAESQSHVFILFDLCPYFYETYPLWFFEKDHMRGKVCETLYK